MKQRQMKGVAGVGEQRERMLAEIGIETPAQLAAAVPANVHGQLVGSGHPVPLDEIAKWVEAAKRKVEAAWQRTATFVVSFESMPDTTPSARRTVVERTEVDEDPAPARTWTGWNCSELCAWMRAQLGSETDTAEPPEQPDQPDQVAPVAAAVPPEPAAPGPPPHRHRPAGQHRLLRASVVDQFGALLPLVMDGRAVVDTTSIALPTRVALTVPSPAGVIPQVWIRLRPTRGDRPAVLLGPASPRPRNGDEVVIDLAETIAPDDYEVTVVVADENGQVAPVTVTLTRAVAANIAGG